MSYDKTNWQNSPSTNTPINAANLNHMEQGIYDATDIAESAAAGVAALQGLNFAPIPVNLAADMTDQTKIYVYLGSEAGYVANHWYYWSGSAWTAGGGYNSLALITDKTLTIDGDAADAKRVGDILDAEIDLSLVTWETNKRVESDGSIGPTTNDYASDYIPVLFRSIVTLYGIDVRNMRCVCCYDDNYDYVSTLVTGNSTTYPTTDSTVTVQIPYKAKYIRVTRHKDTVSYGVRYASVIPGAYNAIFNTLYDGRPQKNFKIAAEGIYSNASAFDPLTDMPYNSSWVGVYSLIKTALSTGGSLATVPKAPSDGATVRLEKWQMWGSTSAIYILISSEIIQVCYRSSNSNNWKVMARTDYTLYDSGATITSSNKSSYFTDADNAPVNQWFEIQKGAEIANTPMGDGLTTAAGVYSNGSVRDFAGYLSGCLYTYKERNGTLTNQIFISGDKHNSQETEPTVIYFRTKYVNGTWSKWHRLSDVIALSASNIAIRKKMIAPYLDGDGNPTADPQYSSNPNPQCMLGDYRIFNDFDDAPNQSIYQIDLDCDASVMAHNPLPGKSSVLITTGFAYATRHGMIQICVGLESGNASMFYRYGYIQSSNPYVYVWTNWQKCMTGGGDVISNEGRADAGTDLNTLKGNSVYLLGNQSTYNYVNTPLTAGAGYLSIKQNDAVIFQVVEAFSGARFTRYSVDTGSTWSNWV